jgi:hypothetical protein
MNAQNKQSASSDSLMIVYGILKMTPDESKAAVVDLAGLQQLAVATVLLKDLSKEEVEELNKAIPSATDTEKQKTMQVIAQKRHGDAEFSAKVKTATDKVLADHIAYLKTRGDAGQKQEIGRILAEI